MARRGTPKGSPSADLRDQIFRRFSGRIQPVPNLLGYRIGWLLVAMAMVLLPLIYLGLVALLAVGVYVHATRNLVFFQAFESVQLAVLAYVGPLFIGLAMILFMVKSLFSRAPRNRAPRTLSKQQEPLVFAFVEEICQRVGAPRPMRIDVDCQVNASASLRGGWRSLLRRDLVLTLGMPLVTGLSLQQFAGVLAHEFGHFTQGGGMRLTYIVRTINNWLWRVAHGRDAWDDKLDRMAEKSYLGAFMIFVWAAKGFVWLTRKVLWGLMWIGHVLSSFMMRQMEFDADRYEVRLVGADVFESTCRELMNLNASHQKSMGDLRATWQDGRLVDDLPALVGFNRRQLSPELQRHLNDHLEQGQTGLFDTHPADKDRIINARHETQAPIFSSELPAAVLFRDVEKMSRQVSIDFYERVLGAEARQTELRRADQVVAQQQQSQAEQEAMESFFCGTIHAYRALEVSEHAAPKNSCELSAIRSRLAGCREELQREKAAYLESFASFDENDNLRLRAHQGEALLDAELGFSAKVLQLPGNTRESVVEVLRGVEEELELSESRLLPYEGLAAERLRLCLAAASYLAKNQPERMPPFTELPTLLLVAQSLGKSFVKLQALRFENVTLSTLGSQWPERRDHESLLRELVASGRRAAEHLHALREFWVDIEYPFDHADPDLTLQRYLLPEGCNEEQPGEVFALAQKTLGNAFDLYGRVMARLALICEGVEEELGFERLDA